MSASKGLMQAASGVSRGPGAGNAWDISTAQWLAEDVNYSSIAAQEDNPHGLFIKPDGTKMYVIGQTGDGVDEYDLSTAWDVSSASFLQYFDAGAQVTIPTDLFFKTDGTKMYILGDTSDDVYEYDLSTAWDVSSASYSTSRGVGSRPEGLFFKPDGTVMYVCRSETTDRVSQYNLSTAWDISSASAGADLTLSPSGPAGLFFKPDGTKMYIADLGDTVDEYDLSTAWDASSATFVQDLNVQAQEDSPQAVSFKSDGTVMYVLGLSDRVYQYQLSTAWDISSASFTETSSRYLDVSAQDDIMGEVFFKPDGLKMYAIGRRNDSVYEYDLSTEWDISTASYLQTFSVSSQEIGPTALFFKPDGTEMYICGTGGDDTNQYSLSTAWDISSASYTRTFDSSSQEVSPQGIFFKPDGLKMYIVGTLSDSINEYDLSTAWDISSASFLQSVNIGTQDNFPTGIFFKPDGTKMYVTGTGAGTENDQVNEYDLSTAWDVSSVSFLQGFNAEGKTFLLPASAFFKPDGLKMYVIDQIGEVFEFDL